MYIYLFICHKVPAFPKIQIPATNIINPLKYAMFHN